MPGRNNTTPIGDGSVGVGNASSISGKMVERAISENNLKYQLAANKPIKGVYNAVLRMVSRWSIADRVRIFQEYGDAKQLPKKINYNNPYQVNRLNDLLARAIIAGLSKNELQRIIKQEESTEARLTNDIRRTTAQTVNNNRKYLNLSNMRQAYGELKQVNNDKQLLKGLKAYGNFKVEKYVKKEALPKLRQELDRFLRGYTKIKIASLAQSLDVTIEDGMSEGELRKEIINLINTYVAILLGQNKQKGVYASQFSSSAINVMEDIISMTSMSWVVGKVLLTDTELKAKKKTAENAKKELEYKKKINKNINNNRARYSGSGHNFTKKDSSGNYIEDINASRLQRSFIVTKNKNKKVSYGMLKAREIFEIDNGVTLREIAQNQYGINVTYLTDSEVIVQVASYIGNEQTAVLKNSKKINKLQAAKDAAEAKGKTLSDRKVNKLNALNNQFNNSSLMTISKYATQANQDFSTKIPVVNYNSQGVIASEAIMSAVPVVVVGYYDKTGRIQSKSDATKAKKYDESRSKEWALSGLDDKYLSASERKLVNRERNKAVNGKINAGNMQYAPSKLLTSSALFGSRGVVDANGNVSIVNPSNGNTINNNTTNNTNNYWNNISNDKRRTIINNMQAGRRQAAQNIANINSSNTGVPVNQLKKIVSSTAYKFWSAKNVDNGINVLPTFDITSTPESLNKHYSLMTAVFGTGKNMTTLGSVLSAIQSGNQIQSGISANLATIANSFAGLQQFGTSANTVAATYMASTLASAVGETAKAEANDMLSTHSIGGTMTKMATGGRAKASSTSSIIAGDPRRGSSTKPNPELMTVNWANKTIDVKPIPQFATGGTLTESNKNKNSNVTGVSRLSATERDAPLNVNISNGLIKYSKTLNDVTDDKSNTAIKVYTVNQSINDKIKVGDSEMSVFDLVYGLYSTVNNISSLMETNNSILSSINQQASNINTNTKNSGTNQSSQGFSFTNELDPVLQGA